MALGCIASNMLYW